MINIENLYTSNWNYEIYKVNNQFVITVIFFGIIDYPRSFSLLEKEISIGWDKLEKLAEDIRNNYNDYEEREVLPAIWQ